MSMTEKQGGSDVRANTTVATPLSSGAGGREPGAPYKLVGHKWFTSAPMSDGFLTLAQTPKGLSCFLVPRWLPDGSRNKGFKIMRLKEKMGDKSNASSEVEYDDAWGQLVGPEGRGVPTIIEMVTHTRLDCMIGSSSQMRQAVANATHHAAHRSAFGAPLARQPLMAAVLAELAVDSEAATLMTFRVARAFDDAVAAGGGQGSPEASLQRIATAVGKYYVCKLAPQLVYEAMECHGGNGYVEESVMPRLFRQSPLNAIWEGSGNVISLDILRALGKEPGTAQAFMGEVSSAAGQDSRFDALLAVLAAELADAQAAGPAAASLRARSLADKMGLALAGSLLLRYSPPAVAEAFCTARLDPASRFAANYGSALAGALSAPGSGVAGSLCDDIVLRAAPRLLK